MRYAALILFIFPLSLFAGDFKVIKPHQGRQCETLSNHRNYLIVNDFVRNRGFAYYSFAFIGFRDEINRVSDLKNGHWLDMGAGLMIAQKEYIELVGDQFAHFHNDKVIPRITGVSYDAVEWSDSGLTANATPNLTVRHLYGLLEDFKDSEIGGADIITDYFGVVSYTRDVSGTLNRYLRLLKKGGYIFLRIGPDGYRTSVIQEGVEQTLFNWLLSFDAVELVKEIGVLKIKYNRQFKFPKLKLKDYDRQYEGVPIRLFNVEH